MSATEREAQVRAGVPFFFLPSALAALVLREVVFSLGIVAVVVWLRGGVVSAMCRGELLMDETDGARLK